MWCTENREELLCVRQGEEPFFSFKHWQREGLRRNNQGEIKEGRRKGTVRMSRRSRRIHGAEVPRSAATRASHGGFMSFARSGDTTSSVAPGGVVETVRSTECLVWIGLPRENRSWGWVSKPRWGWGEGVHTRGSHELLSPFSAALSPWLHRTLAWESGEIYWTW